MDPYIEIGPMIHSYASVNEIDTPIISCYPVRRPLAIPSANDKYGQVLSHSAIVAQTSNGYYIIEYMYDDLVYIHKIDDKDYVPGNNFVFQDFLWKFDNNNPQAPKRRVTIRRLAISMYNNMKSKPFDTFVHNCHLARYLTMKKYGMNSKNPSSLSRCIFFQGFFDFFGNDN